MDEKRVAVLGATSPVGSVLVELLRQSSIHVFAFSRSSHAVFDPSVEWVKYSPGCEQELGGIPNVVCLAPVWVVADYFSMFEAMGIKRIVVLSSTSRFTKTDSIDPDEQVLTRKLEDGERRLQEWADKHGVEWTILRPTLIYGGGVDRNITQMARLIGRFHVFPLLGGGKGLRQPIHREDVAKACIGAMMSPDAANKAYNISGAEVLSYRDMAARVFEAMGYRPRFISIPLFLFRLSVILLRLLPRFRNVSAGMAQRMTKDMVFDHSDAVRDFEFSPRPFRLTEDDLP